MNIVLCFACTHERKYVHCVELLLLLLVFQNTRWILTTDVDLCDSLKNIMCLIMVAFEIITSALSVAKTLMLILVLSHKVRDPFSHS